MKISAIVPVYNTENMSDEFIERQTELENCTFVKTILMLLVILCHSIDFWSGGGWFSAITPANNSQVLGVIANWISSFHVYSFTLVSGYIYGCLRNEKGKYDRFGDFICNKIKRLILPYAFVAAVWVIPITQYFFRYDNTQILYRYILAENPSQLWFLWMLFDVFLISRLLDKVIKNDIAALLISVIAFAIGIVGDVLTLNVFNFWTACTYLSFFILGMKLREKQDWIIRRIPIGIYIVIDLILFIIWYMITGHRDIFILKAIGLGVEFALHIAGALTSFFVLQKVATVFKGWQDSKGFMSIYEKSMPLYLFHQQIIYCVIFLLNGRVSPYVNAVANFVVSVTVSMFISTILMKFKITRVLIGEK